MDDIIDKYGVVKGSYDEVPLPKIQAFVVDKVRDVADAAVKKPSDMFELKSEAIPGSLEWGQILLSVRAAPPSLSATVTVRGPVNVAVPSTRAMPAFTMRPCPARHFKPGPAAIPCLEAGPTLARQQRAGIPRPWASPHAGGRLTTRATAHTAACAPTIFA